MLVLWLLHNGVTRKKRPEIVGVGRATVQRYVVAFREGGLDGLRRWNLNRPVSELVAYRELIRESFENQPARTVAEAAERIFETDRTAAWSQQVRKFLKDLGLKWQCIHAIPVPPKKTLAEHVAVQADFLDSKLKPCLDSAQAGEGHVFFVDAAHFVLGTFLCCLWSFTRISSGGFRSSAIQCAGCVERR